MRALAPRLQLELPLRVVVHPFVLAAPLVVVGQVMEHLHYLAIEPFSLERGPFLKNLAVFEKELF